MLILGISSALVLVALGILAAMTQIADFPELPSLVATLNLEQAELQHMEALNTAARRFETKPQLSMNRQEFEYYVMLAILTKDRAHQFKRIPNGPKVRKKWRRELIVQIKEIARQHDVDRVG